MKILVKYLCLFQNPQNWNFVQQKIRVGYVYIEESFDIIFNVGYGSGKSAMDDRVNYFKQAYTLKVYKK